MLGENTAQRSADRVNNFNTDVKRIARSSASSVYTYKIKTRLMKRIRRYFTILIDSRVFVCVPTYVGGHIAPAMTAGRSQ